MDKYTGNDNYGNPKSEYVAKVESMTDEELFKEIEQKIWLSAYANNNPRSDYHWHVYVCYDECKKRNNVKLYEKAYNAAFERS